MVIDDRGVVLNRRTRWGAFCRRPKGRDQFGRLAPTQSTSRAVARLGMGRDLARELIQDPWQAIGQLEEDPPRSPNP
jgi:hypothetical protein